MTGLTIPAFALLAALTLFVAGLFGIAGGMLLIGGLRITASVHGLRAGCDPVYGIGLVYQCRGIAGFI